MAEKILIKGAKGGTGATTFAVWLGRSLAELGERTLIVDGDRNNSCATVIADCRDLIVYTLADYEKGACRAKQTLVAHPSCSNLLFMPALGAISDGAVEKAVKDVDGLFDYILLDNTSGRQCNRAIIVTEPYAPSVKCADFCRSVLADCGVENITLAVNKLSAELILGGASMTAREAGAVLRLDTVAVIPEDLLITSGKLKSRTKKAFRLAALKISGKGEEVFNVLSGFAGLSGYIKRKIREKL